MKFDKIVRDKLDKNLSLVVNVIMSRSLILCSCYCRLTTHIAFSLSFRGILDANKLIGLNYINWLRNLKIILTQKKVSYILDTPAPDFLEKDASKEERVTYKM